MWDPARNYWKDAPSLGVDDPERPPAFVFDTHSIWHGLKGSGDAVLCEGLLRDWVRWQTTGDEAFEQLKRVLAHLSPREGDVALRPGTPTRVSLGDVRDVPTLAMPYGDVPIVHASAAMRRVAALAYLLVWSFREHARAQTFLGKKPERRIIFLIDEIEAHLHPSPSPRRSPSSIARKDGRQERTPAPRRRPHRRKIDASSTPLLD